MSDTQKQIDEWADRAAKDGLSGGATVITDISGQRSPATVALGEDASIEGSSETRVPDDLVPHVLALLRERDRLIAVAKSESIVTDLPSLRAACFAHAIENIRRKLKEEANVESTGSAGRHDRSEPGSDAGATQAGAEAGSEAQGKDAPDAA